MSKLFFLTIPLMVCLNDFSVDIAFLEPANVKGLSIKVQVKNLSNKTIKVLKNRWCDYKWSYAKSLGNYIIEIEKWKFDRYQLFSPSSDIDPVRDIEEYISLEKGDSITDILNIEGRIYSNSGDPTKGFPVGNYRVRILFHSDQWSKSPANTSAWINFKIE